MNMVLIEKEEDMIKMFFSKKNEPKPFNILLNNAIKKNRIMNPFKDSGSSTIESLFPCLDDCLDFLIESNRIKNYHCIEIKPLRIFTIKKYIWFAENGRIIDTYNSKWQRLLMETEVLFFWYESFSSNINHPLAFDNAVKLKPYIINLKDLIEKFYREEG